MRKENWERHLIETIEAAQKRPFVFGESDCCLFAADVFEAMTGTDPASKWRGKYKSEKGAIRMLKRIGGGGFVEAMEIIMLGLGLEEVKPVFAQRGDVVLVMNGGRHILGVIDSRGLITAMSTDGVVQLPLDQAERAWRI